MLLLGFLLLPPTWRFLVRKKPELFSKKARIIGGLMLLSLAIVTMPASTPSTQKQATLVSTVPTQTTDKSKKVTLKLLSVKSKDGKYQLSGEYSPKAKLILKDSSNEELATTSADKTGKFEFKNISLTSSYTKVFVYEEISTGWFSSKQQQINSYKYIDKKSLGVLSELPVVVKEITTTESIPFSSRTVESSSLAKGKTEVSQEGVNGEKTNTYKITYKGDTETGRELIGSEITKQPVDKITTEGTYVYVAPSTGSSSSTSQSTSSGRTGAICRDGSQSSATGRGACSHHGGVAQWLYS